MLVLTKLFLTNIFVMTTVLLRQNNKHNFVAASILIFEKCLSRQMRICSDKSFVVTEMVLVAAPANDTFLLLPQFELVIWLYIFV